MEQKKSSEGFLFGLFVGLVCMYMIIVCILISLVEEQPGIISKLFVKMMMVELIAISYIFKSPKKERIEMVQGR